MADVRRICTTLPTPRRPLTNIPGMQGAAVLAPIFADDDGLARVILTKRPDTMPSHRGDVAFPGGKFHPELDRHLLDSALREAEEEIGLHRDAVEVVGEMDTLSTVTTRFLVAPFIGLLRHRPVLTPHPEEVAGVFDVALAELLADDVHREEYWGIGGMSRPVHFFELEDEVIWGVTARILASFLILLTATG
jgi:8-oxo-dGTP pyrophosphatase MutT (NUDIX family)